MSTTSAPEIAASTAVVDNYIAMWNETDAGARAKLIGDAWSTDGRYVDPVQEAAGHDAISDMVAAIHERFPGQRFTRTSAVDEHHATIRFGWQLGAPDGEVTVAGIDVGALAEDGRLARIAGFFGDLSPLES